MRHPDLRALTGRPKNKFIQLALDTKNLKESQKEDIKFPLWGSVKVDGVFCIAWKHSEGVSIYSRTGEVYTSMRHLEDILSMVICLDDLIIFEAFANGVPQPTISGWARDTKQQHTELRAYCHDLIRLEDFLGQSISLPYRVRRQVLENQLLLWLVDPRKYPEIRMAEHEVMYNWEKVYIGAEKVWSLGGEGLVLRDPSAPYEPGKRNKSILKVKRGVSYDLEVVGMNEGKGKYEGTLGTLVCRWKSGNIIEISGMTDAQRFEWWDMPRKILGKIVQVDAMCESSKGVLREPRFKGIRYDKTEGDF